MGFPVASAYYKNIQICQTTSRPKGYNIHLSSNKSSFCAEYRLFKILSNIYPDTVRKKGKKLIIFIDISGKCSKPCKNCKNLYSKFLPFCKIKYKENGNYYIKNPSLIPDTIYSNGVNKYKRERIIN